MHFDFMEWKRVPVYTNYEVSETGLLRRAVNGSNSLAGKLIVPTNKDYGSLSYWLYRDAKARQVMAPVIVAEAFLTITDNIYGIKARDGDIRNCHYRNLQILYPEIPSVDIAWKTIPLSEEYEVSEYGHVRSKRKKFLLTDFNKLNKPYLNRGYYYVSVPTARKLRPFPVHQLVLYAFYGPPTGDANQGCHNDGNSRNNHFTNLRWGTPLDNVRDREMHRLQRMAQ